MICQACGGPMTRRTNESKASFRLRKACSTHCAGIVRERTKAAMRAAAPPIQRDPCSEDGCDAPATKRGMCPRHYQREYARERRAAGLPYGGQVPPKHAPLPVDVRALVECGDCGLLLGFGDPWPLIDRHRCTKKGKR